MPRIFLILLWLYTFISAGNPASLSQSNKNVRLTYTGNMGVLISNQTTAVWIDGLHEFYGPEYLNPPDSLLETAIARNGIFSHINYLLFTHYHRDHFSVKLARRFLRSGHDYIIAGASQVIDSLPAKNVIQGWNQNRTIVQDTLSSLTIKAFNIPHVWPQRHSKVQNLAYLLELGAIRILHIGDAECDVDAFQKTGIGKIDVFIVPAWFPGNENANKIVEQFNPKKIIVTHISPGDKIEKTFPFKNTETISFEKMGQSISL